ncbi:MAG: helix-turn-helix domain-containing protein, partial [Bacteroidia bacterium]|nr:helix-turn-helix domain-containing protein [Bacteroidia bacterium]
KQLFTMKHTSTVLAANINKGLITALTVVLKKVFNKVILAPEKDEIIDKIKNTENIDVIVLDISTAPLMGDKKDWIDIIKGINSLDRGIQIITLTTFSDNALSNMSIRAGAFDSIPKPWSNDKLTISLGNALKYKRCLDKINEIEQEKELLAKEITELKQGTKKHKRIKKLEDIELEAIENALERCEGNITMAAQRLGVTRQTLYNKGKKHNLFK